MCVCIQMLDEVQYDVPTADTGFTNTAYSTINTDENVAYGASIGLNDVSVLIQVHACTATCIYACVCIHQMLDEVQYEQADVPTADTGFTMSTNTAYSAINTDENIVWHKHNWLK